MCVVSQMVPPKAIKPAPRNSSPKEPVLSLFDSIRICVIQIVIVLVGAYLICVQQEYGYGLACFAYIAGRHTPQPF